jgi:crotonobetainyl-CoA:carnitine CoA-transferase CaiB-like acyl-CoA transferase
MALKLLNGLKLVEVGETVAVAFTGKILADLGADVVTVEPPGGSQLRQLPPHHQDIPGPGQSVLHAWLSMNKRSVTLDREQPQGQEILQRLLRGADALVRGPKAGLDLRAALAANPHLGVTTISPFGTEGPYADYRANDLTLFATSGFSYYLVSPVDDPVNTPPKQNPGYQVGLVAGLTAANATLWGLGAGRRRGQGVMVDVSECEAFAHLLYEHIGWLSEGTLASDRQRAPGAAITVVGGLVWCLPCADGWVLVSPREDHQFKQWSAVMGAEEWAGRPEFSTPALREEHAWQIFEKSASWTRDRKKADIYQAAQGKKVACFPVSQMSDLPELAQLQHRAFFIDSDHPVITGVKYPGLPIRTDARAVLPNRPAPLPGEHTVEVCRELGVPEEEIETLRGLAVI